MCLSRLHVYSGVCFIPHQQETLKMCSFVNIVCVTLMLWEIYLTLRSLVQRETHFEHPYSLSCVTSWLVFFFFLSFPHTHTHTSYLVPLYLMCWRLGFPRGQDAFSHCDGVSRVFQMLSLSFLVRRSPSPELIIDTTHLLRLLRNAVWSSVLSLCPLSRSPTHTCEQSIL